MRKFIDWLRRKKGDNTFNEIATTDPAIQNVISGLLSNKQITTNWNDVAQKLMKVPGFDVAYKAAEKTLKPTPITPTTPTAPTTPGTGYSTGS